MLTLLLVIPELHLAMVPYTAVMAFTFSKSERLTARKSIQALFKSGKRTTVFPISCIYIVQPQQPGVQVGFSVSKRNIKTAVKRNRMKRLMREAYRLQKQDLKDFCDTHNVGLHVFFIYLGKDLAPYATIGDKIHHLLLRLQEVVKENYAKA